MTGLAVLTLIAFVLDLLIGDPAYGLHPIRIIGRWLEALEGRLRRVGLNGIGGGWVLAGLTTVPSVGVFFLLSLAAGRVHPWLAHLLHLYLLYACLALGDLFRHVHPVVQRLEATNLSGARRALARIVGRDVASLDAWGVGRAAVETLAENFVDGFLSPLLWLLAGGMVADQLGWPVAPCAIGALLTFKCVSTLDSMVGYRNERYLYFGRAGARLDDVMNFVPARLCIPILSAGSLLSGTNPVQGLRTAARDRLAHDSPNAGHAESFTAGSLGIRLGGPASYEGIIKKKPWLGSGSPEVGPAHIRATLTLLRRSAWIATFLVISVLLLPSFIPS